MAQLSRPVQVGVLVCAVLALAVLFALHRSGATSSSSGSSSPSVSSSSPSSSSSSSSGAPGVEGLTRDIQRAHGAVAQVQHNAQEVQSKAAAAPTGAAGAAASTTAAVAGAAHGAAGSHGGSAGTRTAHSAAHPAGAASSRSKGAATSSKTVHHGPTAASQPAAAPPSTSATASLTLHNLTTALHLTAVVKLVELLDPALQAKAKIAHAEGIVISRLKSVLQPASQATVAAELHHGKTVLLLFMNPHSYDDDATAIGTAEVAHKLRHSVVAHLALASQVNSFGAITRDIQIYQTPTLLIVNPKRQVTTLPGLTDEFALEQAIAEAKS